MFKPETVYMNNKAKTVWYWDKLNFFLKVIYVLIKDSKIYKQVGGVLIDQTRK